MFRSGGTNKQTNKHRQKHKIIEIDKVKLITSRLKPRPNDRNMSTQHIATSLGATCCVRLATVLRCVETWWVLLAQIWPFSNLSQQHPTCLNTSQHGGQTHATCCAQQCCDMLRWHVAIVWPEIENAKPTMLGYVVVKSCDRLAGASSYIAKRYLYPGRTVKDNCM